MLFDVKWPIEGRLFEIDEASLRTVRFELPKKSDLQWNIWKELQVFSAISVQNFRQGC